MKFRTGYDIVSDLPHGFTLHAWGLTFNLHFAAPKAVWYNQHWAVNEKGYVQGMPVLRQRRKWWLLRGFTPPRLDVRFRP